MKHEISALYMQSALSQMLHQLPQPTELAVICATSTSQSDFVSLIEHRVSVLSVIGDIHCINLHCYHLQMVAGQ